MTQQSGNQFDDDLTVGMEDNGTFSTDSIDLFEFSGGEESPIARLKTIILSIDWEINDDILQQLEEELVDLSDIWAGDKIKLIYIQGLSKIGKYIYKEKAKAQPNAIKLLITFYHNLEKIVSADDEMSDEDKKQLLLEDVRKFDQLKSQIGEPATSPVSEEMPAALSTEESLSGSDEVEELKVLKAQVLGIDWEINDQEIQKLSDEVQRLETVFSSSKAKCILLQGIGSISSYINKMRSKSNSQAFPLLHSFYGVLEKISTSELPPGDEKQLLLAEVNKFKTFKKEIANSEIPPEPEAVPEPEKEVVAETSTGQDEPVAESKIDDGPVDSLAVEDSDDEEEVASDVASRLASVFGEIEDDEEVEADKDAALEGVDVETEADDDSDEEALPFQNGAVAPALAEVEEESSFSVEKLAGDLAQFAEEDEAGDGETEVESLLQGVDVETEADDDSDEEALPFEGGEIAPALSGSDDEDDLFGESLAEDFEEPVSDDIDNRLDSFFDDEVQASSDGWGHEGEEELSEETQELSSALSDVVEGDDDIFEAPVEETLISSEVSSEFLDESPAPALSDSDEATSFEEGVTDETVEETLEDKLSFFDEDTPASESVDEPVLEDEEQVEDSADEQLSFLDEEPDSPDLPEEESLEPEAAIFDSEEEDLPAPESVEAEESELSFQEDEPASALSEEAEEPTTFEAEEVAEETGEALSFLDEEPESLDLPEAESLEPEAAIFDSEEEDLPVPESTEAEVSEYPFQEDQEDEPVPALSEETEEPTIFETEEVTEDAGEALSFLDEEPESAESPEEEISEPGAAIFDSEEDAADTDEIAFVVPGEEISETVAAAIADDKEFAGDEDVIDFLVPGEGDSVAVENEELVFEVVDDSVEIDMLPGEAFVELPSDIEGQAAAVSPDDQKVVEDISVITKDDLVAIVQTEMAEIRKLVLEEIEKLRKELLEK